MDDGTRQPRVAALYRYPVKGLTPERLDAMSLDVGQTVPFDRVYAIEAGSGKFDPEQPKCLPKINFLMLARNAKLAAIESVFDTETHTLTIRRAGRQVARGRLDTWLGRSVIEQFFAAYCADELKGAPRIVCSDGHSFSDMAAECVHVVNLETVRELERSLGRPVDPLRFRANIYVEGLPSWSEFGWEGEQIVIGGARLKVFARTTRCDATNVDPKTGVRDLSIPAHLTRTYGNQAFGVYAEVTGAGEIRTGDTVVA